MVNRASARSIQQAVDGPDYEAAIGIIEGRIADAKNRQSKAGGDASAAWKDIEKMGVDRVGAQMFAKVLNMDNEEGQRDRALRAFSILCERADITIPADLVDSAEGRVQPVVPQAAAPAAAPAPAAPQPPSDDSDLAGDDDSGDTTASDGAPAGDGAAAGAEAAPKKGGSKPRLSIVDSRAAAKAHLSGTSVPGAMD